MAGEIKIGGQKIPKNAAIAIGAVTVGIIGYAYWARRGTGSGDVPTDTGTTTDTSIDPTTGLPYADEYGYGTYGVPNYSGVGIYDPATGGTIGGYTGYVQTLSTNAQWAQASLLYLQTVGYEGTKATAALGKALTGQAMNDEEIAIFNTARAFEGEPPQGYPNIVHVPTTPPGTTNPGPSGKGPVTGLHQVNTGSARTSIRVDWNPVSGAKGYTIYRNGARITTVLFSTASVNASPGKSYKITVTPVMSNGALGTPKSITGRTKK